MLTTSARILLGILATYRLARLFSMDDGPFGIFDKMRSSFGRAAAGKEPCHLLHTLADLINCPYCLGIWFASVATVAVLLPNTITDILLIALAIAGAQDFLQSLSDKQRE